MTGTDRLSGAATGRPNVQRVSWLPGSDRLSGRCFCGAESEAEDPVQMWEWLLAHPDHPKGGPDSPPGPVTPPPAHVVRSPDGLRRVPVPA